MADKKKDNSKIRDKLLEKKRFVVDVDKKALDNAMEFCEGYKLFLNQKTEREVVDYTIPILEENGYEEFVPGKKYNPGDKVYKNGRGKVLIMATIGKMDPSEGMRITVAHTDSPRLDFKPITVFEKSGLGYFKSHYYGGIKRYQWACFPMSLHGVVCLKNGEKVKVLIGEEEGDPVFTVNDLLVHLARDQMAKDGSKQLEGEQLNLMVGSLPYGKPEEPDRVKLNVMKMLYDKYGITESDLISAEICAVPAFKAQDVGLDRSLIGGYGQDDSSCAYAILMAEINTKDPEFTTVTMLAEKEETGSGGPTGMKSLFYRDFMEDLIEPYGVKARHVFERSICLSCDVDGGFDPNFPEVSDPMNSSFLGKGCVVVKYDGSGGKYASTDASAETMAYVRDVFDRAKVVWQIGLLGKIGAGGGGTVAGYVANNNIDTIGLGVGVLSMHSPFEVTSKVDIYMLYKAVKAFYESDKPKY